MSVDLGSSDAGSAVEMLVRVSGRLSRLYTTALSELEVPLTFRQYRLLARVYEGYQSLSALARLAMLTLPTVSESVDVLTRRGLLTRSEHPDDRRAIVVGITELGVSVFQTASSTLDELGVRILGFAGTDLPRLGEDLTRIYEAATSHLQDRVVADGGTKAGARP